MRAPSFLTTLCLILIAGTIAPAQEPKPANVDDDATLKRIAAEAVELTWAGVGPVHPMTLVDIAEAQAKYGDVAAARETLRRAADAAAEARQSITRRGESAVGHGPSSAQQLWDVGNHQISVGDEMGARETLERALRASDPEERPSDRIATLRRIASDLVRLGAIEKARGVAERAETEVKEMRPPVDVVGDVLPELAAVHAAAGNLDRALDVIARIEAMTREERERNDRVGKALAEMARGAEALDPATATALLQRIGDRLLALPLAEDKAGALTNLAMIRARIGDFEGAIEAARMLAVGPSLVIHDMRDSQAYALHIVASEMRKQGDIDGARTTLRDAFELAKDSDDARRFGHVSMIAQEFLELGDLDDARRCVDAIGVGYRSEILARLAVALKVRGEAEAADRTFHQAIEDAESRRGRRNDFDRFPGSPAPDEATWNDGILHDIVTVRALKGEYDAARRLAATINDPSNRAWALEVIAREQASAGQAESALRWAREAKDLPDGYRGLYRAIIEGVGQYFQSRDTAKRP